MKEEKTLFGKKLIPEKEWEAKYLVELTKSNNNYGSIIWVLICALLAIMLIGLFYLFSQPCSIEFQGNIEGNANAIIGENWLIGSAFDSADISITQVEGKVKVQVPCYLINNWNR